MERWRDGEREREKEQIHEGLPQNLGALWGALKDHFILGNCHFGILDTDAPNLSLQMPLISFRAWEIGKPVVP